MALVWLHLWQKINELWVCGDPLWLPGGSKIANYFSYKAKWYGVRCSSANIYHTIVGIHFILSFGFSFAFSFFFLFFYFYFELCVYFGGAKRRDWGWWRCAEAGLVLCWVGALLIPLNIKDVFVNELQRRDGGETASCFKSKTEW